MKIKIENISSKCRSRVGRGVARTVAACCMLAFLGSYGALALILSSSDSRFAKLAMGEHQGHFFWTNLSLLPGYVVAALGYILLVYPIIRIWLGEERVPGRWSVIWRTLAVLVVILAWLHLNLHYSRPYLLKTGKLELFHGLPEPGRVALGFALFILLPFAALAAVSVYYGFRISRWLKKKWGNRAAKVLLAAVGGVSFASVMWCCFPEGAAYPEEKSDGPMNVLILASDSLRADHLSCNGYPRPTSPNIDRLAANSVNFTGMMTPIASTLESMTTTMTGQYPHTHGIRTMYPSREEVESTLKTSPQFPDILRRNGWHTSVIGDWCAGIFKFMPFGFEQVDVSEFDDFRLYLEQAIYLAHPVMMLHFDNAFGYWIFPKMRSFATYVTPKAVTGQLRKRLREEAAEPGPFLITAFYSCTHFPYVCPPPYHRLFSSRGYRGKNQFKLDFDLAKFVKGEDFEAEFRGMPPEEVAQVRALYDGTVRFFDDQVGEVLSTLEACGLAENTIVIITSDHGEDLFEPGTTINHGLSFSGGDQANHIPFILHVPDGKYPSRRVAGLSRTIDVAPTILELLNLKPEPRFEGRSLVPCLQNSQGDGARAFYGETSFLFFTRHIPGEQPLGIPPLEETVRIDPAFDWHFVVKPEYREAVLRAKERCLRTENWKLVFTPGVQRDIWRLYDLTSDPSCLQNVAGRNPAVLGAMSAALRRWVETGHGGDVAKIFPEGEP